MFIPNLVKKSVHGGLLGKGVNLTFCVTFFIYLFIIIFFSDQRREETPGRILTRSKDAESRKDVPF